MINWFRKHVLKQHVCEEFTRWETVANEFSRPSNIDDGIFPMQTLRYTRRWQERICTICGALYKRDIDDS